MEKENPSSISKAGAAKMPDLNSSFTTPESRKDRPSDVEGRFRAWAGRAKEYGKMAAQRERVLAGGSPGLEPLKGQAAVLRQKEREAWEAFHRVLSGSPLPPLQQDVLCRHYLQYQSWSQMAEDTGYSRRYLLQLNARGMRALREWAEAER